ncbi:hypothetical protein TNCV_4169681 [Trichonephila clavipes]|nr:hypothetical protein TNCV_4169681 [Trichonephila clavipes]
MVVGTKTEESECRSLTLSNQKFLGGGNKALPRGLKRWFGRGLGSTAIGSSAARTKEDAGQPHQLLDFHDKRDRLATFCEWHGTRDRKDHRTVIWTIISPAKGCGT